MKFIHQLVHLLFGHKSKKQGSGNPAGPDHGSARKDTQKPKPTPISDDDSPPGYKIRWHH